MSVFISSNYEMLIGFMIFIILLGILIMVLPFIKRNGKSTSIEFGLSDKEIIKIDNSFDKEEFKLEVFELYKRMETYKSKFKFEELKEVLDEELYIEEESNLKKLKNDKQKLVSTNIKLCDFKVLDIKKDLIRVYLYVSQYSYVIDSKKSVIRGTDSSVYNIEYIITIKNNLDKHFKIKEIKCTGKWISNN